MGRRLITLASVVSIVLCLAAAAAWVMSYPFGDEWRHLAFGRFGFVLSSHKGQIGVQGFVDGGADRLLVFGVHVDELDDMSLMVHQTHTAGGFGARVGVVTGRFGDPITRCLGIFMPHWFGVMIAGVPSLLWYRRRLAERHVASGHFCGKCGYDLRATPTCCPECGELSTHSA